MKPITPSHRSDLDQSRQEAWPVAGVERRLGWAILVTGGAGLYRQSHGLGAAGRGRGCRRPRPAVDRGHAWAVAPGARLVVGDVGDGKLVASLIENEGIESILHFAGSVVVPDSVADPLGYYLNNTCNTRTLIEEGGRRGVKQFIFSSTAAVYGMPPADAPISEAVAPARSRPTASPS